MIKKKLNIFLLLLLALLFTSLLGTTCYAYNYIITDSDIDLIVDYYISSSYRSQFKSRLKTYLNDLYNVQNFDTCVIGVNSYSNQYWIDLYGFNSSSVTAIGSSKNVNYMNVTINSNGMKYEVYVNNGNYQYTNRQTWTGGNFGSGSQLRTRYLCVPNDLGNGLFEGPWQSTDILTFSPNDYFVFTLNQNLDSFNIDGDSVPLIDFQNNSANQVVLGYLDLAENFDYAELFTYRWYQNKWKLINIKRVDDVGTLQNDFINVILKGDDYLGDTLYSYQFNSVPDKDFENYSQPFYIKTKYTVITNGSLDIVNTFSGDYYTNYNNDTNTQNVIGTLTDEQQEQQSLNELDNLFSGDINQLADQFGFVDLADPVIRYFSIEHL